MNQYTLTPKEQETQAHWISIAGMMAGLMAILLFIAIGYTLHVRAEKHRVEKIITTIEEIAVTYKKLRTELYTDLEEAFKDDLDKWNAVLDQETLSVRFKRPRVLFIQGKVEVHQRFKDILDDFFPRYIQILRQSKYMDNIAEVRIEGHTSSEWSENVSDAEAYILNMELSHDRTRSVLEYVLQIAKISENRKWLKDHLTANGLSSSKLISKDGIEDKEESRRITFRVRTNAEKQISEIIKRGEEK